MEEENDTSTVEKKRHRHKKKQLYASILKQMEFYFSDAAISKDRFLSQLTAKDPYVALDVFLTFNKVKALTDRTEDIARALRGSTLLELSEDSTKVKRINPYFPYDTDSRTVYVESIPASADLRWLSNVFQAYGPVAYVSLPKYFKTDRIKGFAFVEFEKSGDAEKCIKAFTNMGCKLPTSIKPETLQSCQGFDDSGNSDSKEQFSNDEKYEEDDAIDNTFDVEPPAKKIKIQDDETEIIDKEDAKIEIINEKPPIIEEVIDVPQDIEVKYSEAPNDLENSEQQDGMEKKSKPVRKRKKKDRKKSRKELEKRGLEGAARGLQILSKKEWKVLRNKYLHMQRKHMKALKQVLRTQHTLPGSRGPLPTTVFPADSSQGMEEQESKPEATATAEIPFVEGVIVTAHLTEPCVNVKELKQSTKANVHVKYVDIKEGSTDIYIRMDDSDAAKQFASSGIFSEARVLAGEEERLYWEELRRQQTGRSSSKRTMRGRDRLIQKAQQYANNSTAPVAHTGRHIRFDD
ncbi:la related protein 7 [Arctopsyche grandis]|uniref:la related protein 7 n=1 Tax=Arctopsyche grandis TaxID=121162 RepID=UPI00406D956E